jgi:putative transposase
MKVRFTEYHGNQGFNKEITTESDFVTEFLNQWHIGLKELLKGEYRMVRNELILELKRRSNLSIGQIADILGVNRNVIQRLK